MSGRFSLHFDDVKTAFRELAKTHHPDMGGDARVFERLQKMRDSVLANGIRQKMKTTLRRQQRSLDRTTTQLYKVVDFFDSDPEDEWDLVEGVHFEFAGSSAVKKKIL